MSSLPKELVPIVKGPIDKLLSIVGDEYRQYANNRLLEYQCEEFNRCLYAKTLLHRSTPKHLDEFYQPLFIEKKKSASVKVQALIRIPTDKAENFFALSKRITLIGSAGSGKSTLVKYLLIKCVQENLKIPIRIELRYLNSYADGDLNKYIINEVFQFQKLGVTVEKIDALLGKSHFVFFFDGFDEVSSSIRSIVANDIDAFTKKYPGNNYVVTSRPYADIELLPLFTNYNVSELSDAEISSFVKKQLPNEEAELSGKIIKAIADPENVGYRSFLSNPLLLSMFILTFQSYSEVPKKRSDFYQQVFDTLFSTHDSMSKLAYVREKQCGLSKQQFEVVLSLFSFVSFFKDQFIFSSNYLNSQLNYVKEKNFNLSFDNDLLIGDLQVAIGILNKEGLDYTFPHRSLQEYFAANYIQQLNQNRKASIYKMLGDDFLKDLALVLNKVHFLTLLAEVDPINIIKYWTLPIVESCWTRVQKTQKIQEIVYYYGTAILSLLWSTNYFRVLDDLSEFIRPEYKLGFPVLYTSLDDTKRKGDGAFKKRLKGPHEGGDSLMIEFASMSRKFKKDGKIMVDYLKNYLYQVDKNEEDVINSLFS